MLPALPRGLASWTLPVAPDYRLPPRRVAVSRTQDTPAFGPALPPGGGPFQANADFRALLLAKALNGEQAASQAGQFHAMATRTRQQYLQDLATNEVTTTSLDSASRFGLPSLGGRRRAPPRGPGAELQAAGALVWGVRAAPGARGAAGAQTGSPDGAEVPCLLGISAEALVLVAPRDGRVVFNCACRDVLAWTFSEQQLDLYHGRGEAITLRLDGPPGQAVGEVVARLQVRPGVGTKPALEPLAPAASCLGESQGCGPSPGAWQGWNWSPWSLSLTPSSAGWLLMLSRVCKRLGGLGRGLRGWRGGGPSSRSPLTPRPAPAGEPRLRDPRAGAAPRRPRPPGLRGGRRGLRHASGALHVRRDGGTAARGAPAARVRPDAAQPRPRGRRPAAALGAQGLRHRAAPRRERPAAQVRAPGAGRWEERAAGHRAGLGAGISVRSRVHLVSAAATRLVARKHPETM